MNLKLIERTTGVVAGMMIAILPPEERVAAIRALLATDGPPDWDFIAARVADMVAVGIQIGALAALREPANAPSSPEPTNQHQP